MEKFIELSLKEVTAITGGKYYGNGVHCGKHSCTVDWGTAIGNIGNNAAANWATGGNAGWNK
ncbi:leucocin A/sakacin P family class II bacteriocin [Latilactobacillus sakei]|uniref:Bacteriocin sakacin-P n=2 Tax=Latilactobacillus sakei TaxID=1599 RepID=SAKP_LATSK|nr:MULTISPECIES: leucocin A/sakacin P family class II bacteriocin [Latilactobacillus]P35618.2 RecName: Full=Bacteriocin sakacin-P; AltName: Full=Sakacin 674; Flags: Precursor [Latilactobacillus sakei]AAB93970.1 sakacin P preprotein [Latilactobacillus sakei]AAM88858.1 sakacin P precursor [Latilactobacillus sakei]AAW79057.1 SppA [Latilactobacillus sakei]EHE85062.1 bacteriocin sakacin-P [Latilactobacillus curvatus CRL 705]MCS6143326.1 bacteriocin sakacin-P [Latilactobacillus curvatus]